MGATALTSLRKTLKAKLTLESDALVGSDEDAETEVVATDDLRQPGVLGVAQPDTTELRWDLKAEGAEFAQSLR